MKLKVLAAAIAASFVFPVMAQAGTIADTMSIDGDIGVFYSDSTESIGELGTELNFDGSAEQDGITYMGHMELDVNGSGGATTVTNTTEDANGNVLTSDTYVDSGTLLRVDEIRVGAKGGFGEVWLGDADNACDQFDPGANDIWLGGQSKSCGGSGAGNILYKNKMGAVEIAASHNPGADETALGARFEIMQGVTANLGYEDGVGEGGDRISYGASGSWNGVDLNLEGNDDDQWGVNAGYSMNGNTFWIGYGDDGSADDAIGMGYRRSHGKMDYIIEHSEQGDADETIVGMRYRF